MKNQKAHWRRTKGGKRVWVRASGSARKDSRKAAERKVHNATAAVEYARRSAQVPLKHARKYKDAKNELAKARRALDRSSLGGLTHSAAKGPGLTRVTARRYKTLSRKANEFAKHGLHPNAPRDWERDFRQAEKSGDATKAKAVIASMENVLTGVFGKHATK